MWATGPSSFPSWAWSCLLQLLWSLREDRLQLASPGCFQLGPVGQPQGLQPLWSWEHGSCGVPSSLLPEADVPSLSAGAIPHHEAMLASLPSWGSPGLWLQEPNLCCSLPVGSWSHVGLTATSMSRQDPCGVTFFVFCF